MNEIRIELRKSPAKTDMPMPRTEIQILLLIDGEEVTAFGGAGIEPCALAASAQQSDELYIANCECGEPGCAGIWRGVRVDVLKNLVSWSIPVPYMLEKGSTGYSGECVVYEFERDAYEAAVAGFIEELKSLLPRQQAGERFDFHGHPGTLVSDILKWIGEGTVL